MNQITYVGNNININYSRNYEIIIADGAGTVTYADRTEKFSAGDIIVIAPLVKFNVEGTGGLRVTLERTLLPEKVGCVIHDDENRGIAYAARLAKAYINSDLQKHKNILDSIGGLLTSYVAAFSSTDDYSPVVKTVINEILTSVSDVTYSLEESLRKLPLNYDYVRKLFQKETGLTPKQYLLRERMELARTIISNGITNRYSEYTVSQIAEACGFSDPLYFSRVFKKYFGVSPSEYK